MLTHAQQMPEGGEGQHRRDVEDEDRGDGVGDLRLGRADDRRDGGDRGGAADAGAHTDQRAQVADDPQTAPDPVRRRQAGGERQDHHRK